jgi:lipopolysaccharide/colanic/teichoic acid biosynthesis glycosyltransferase
MSVRLFDRVVAAVALLLLGPLLVVVGLVVRATSRGPALHRANRAGLGGYPFTLLKFRSMVVDAAAQGTSVTAAGDPRITPVGRFLRATKIDELPQMINVLRGEMGLVGARPEDPRYVDLDDPLHRELYLYVPGITGAASVAFRSEETLLAEAVELGTPHEEAYGLISREKMEIDLEYLRRRTVGTDVAMIGRTVASILRRPHQPAESGS